MKFSQPIHFNVMGAYDLLFKNNGEKIISTTLKKTHTDFG